MGLVAVTACQSETTHEMKLIFLIQKTYFVMVNVNGLNQVFK
jgi:hypothetical protein